LTRTDLEKGLQRLSKLVEEVEAFDPDQIRERYPPEVGTLENRVKDAIEKTFPVESTQYNRYIHAGDIHPLGSMYMGAPPPVSDYVEQVKGALPHTISTLRDAIRSIEDELTEIGEQPPSVGPPQKPGQPNPKKPSRKVFIVHGHDDGTKETVARFVEAIGYQAVILHEQASKGQTVIEKIEANKDVDFAIVLLTPDDVGSAAGGELKPRARQNVILELGYFIAHLKRSHVVALMRDDIEVPSDFSGVIYISLDTRGAWKSLLAVEMKSAGLDIDLNKAAGF
jgi:predicted nucleotide-binding protein